MRRLAFALFASAGARGGRRPSKEMLKSEVQVVTVPILSDNYSYLIVDRKKGVSAVVDPAEPRTMIEAAEKEDVELTTVLTTHHHWDHAGGNDEIKKLLPKLKIYGPKTDNIPSATDLVEDGDQVQIVGSDETFQVLGTPCHTRGHVCYYSSSTGSVFTGDTLFLGGCGRFFEGDAKDMYSSLEKLAALPSDTRVFCGHEYTLSNLKFALSVDPDNQAIKDKIKWSEDRRKEGLPTVPGTVGEELTYNPFMRTKVDSIQQTVKANRPEQVMKLLRERKNRF